MLKNKKSLFTFMGEFVWCIQKSEIIRIPEYNPNVYNYILNQGKHHNKQTFQEEYMDSLKKFESEHDVKYLFEWIE